MAVLWYCLRKGCNYIPHHNVKSTFSNNCISFGMVTTKQAKKELPESSFCCTDPMCV